MINDLTTAWLNTLHRVLTDGQQVSPRCSLTLELPQHTTVIDMRRPVLTIPTRKLAYKFMAAEAYWILSGDNTVEGIASYNANIAKFSDDGKIFFGAYGPRIKAQLDYVVKKLVEDPMSRQAGLTIWRENPPKTKDVPCTVSIFFSIREGLLNCHVFMRSNDVWLGMPYDLFNFAMLGHLVCAKINHEARSLNESNESEPDTIVEPGAVYLTAASCHLYREHWDRASECLTNGASQVPLQAATPKNLYLNEWLLIDWLKKLRDVAPDSSMRWWNDHA